MASLAAARWIPDASVDLVYLDGDHRLSAVAADIAAWRPKVRRGGVLAGREAAPAAHWRAIEGGRGISEAIAML